MQWDVTRNLPARAAHLDVVGPPVFGGVGQELPLLLRQLTTVTIDPVLQATNAQHGYGLLSCCSATKQWCQYT